MKRFILLLMLCICTSLSIALAATQGDFQYAVIDDEVHITGYTGSEKKVSIPKYIEGQKVTHIAASAFENKETITRIQLPKYLSNIESKAFAGCTGLSTMSVGENVTYIADDAFENCYNLVVKLYQDSYAHLYFMDAGIPFRFFKEENESALLEVITENPHATLQPFSVEVNTDSIATDPFAAPAEIQNQDIFTEAPPQAVVFEVVPNE